ncbi:MAG: ATP-binding protein, partial [Paludibacter sp.]
MEEFINESQLVDYGDSNIITLEGLEHVRRRPGMYIGKLGDGTHVDDGIYVLLKEVLDNCIDEYRMGAGRNIDVSVVEGRVSVRDYGRGIPLGKMIEAVSIMNTGGKYDSKAFKKSVGLNGVGTKAVNALSSTFVVQSFREGQSRKAEFEKGKLISDSDIFPDNSDRGTKIYFEPDSTMFENYVYKDEFIETMLRNYAYLNTGLT